MSECCGDLKQNCTVYHEECFNCTCSCYKESYILADIDRSCHPIFNLPGERCNTIDDCLEGLICYQNSTCACIAPCLYDDTSGVCDCGSVVFETPVKVHLLGVGLGLLSILIWMFSIVKTISTAHERKNIITRRSTRRVSTVSDYRISSIRPFISFNQNIKTNRTQEDRTASVCHGSYEVDNLSACRAPKGTSMEFMYYEPTLRTSTAKSAYGRHVHTPNPYSNLRKSTPPNSDFQPMAPVNPQYPSTLLPPEETENLKYFR